MVPLQLFQMPILLCVASSACLLLLMALAPCHAELVSASDDCTFFIFSISSLMQSFPPFLLKEKVGQKFKAALIAPRRQPCPRTTTTPLFLHRSFTCNHNARVLTRTNFFKHPYCSELK